MYEVRQISDMTAGLIIIQVYSESKNLLWWMLLKYPILQFVFMRM